MNASEQNIANDETVLQPVVKDDEITVVKTVVNGRSRMSTDHLTVGSTLQNRFVLKEVIGQGGMGTVYRATDLRRQEAKDHQTDVAIKILNEEFKNDPELFIALQRETKKSQILAHPNIVTVHDFDRDGNDVFMVMELLEGKSLSQFIRDECSEGLAFKVAWPIIKGLLLALAYAHKKNIIHSDFKPGNVIITAEGGVKVLDFGIACAVVNSETHQTDTVFNPRDLGALTPAYASLEMFEGKPPVPADDVYALACVCYEILVGKHPYGKLSAQKALELNIGVPVIHGLDRRQRFAINHALSLRSKQRTSTIHDFFAEIEPQSIWPKALGGIVIITILAVAGGYYYVLNEFQVFDKEIRVPLSPEQLLRVKDLLELAEIHLEVGYLTAPAGSNALWAFRQVLDTDPYNQEAQTGLKKIRDIVYKQAIVFYEAGKYKESLAKIEAGLEAVPKDESLFELKNNILSSGLIWGGD